MRIISWNIQWGRGCDDRVDLDRIARVAGETAEADVLCLQEVAVNFPGLAGSSGEDQVALLSRAFPGYQACYGIATDLPDGRGGRSLFGNLLLSRLPLLQVWRHLLPWPADPLVPSMQRCCVEAVVQAPFGPLRVLTTHLEYYSAAQRSAQVEALRALHAEACGHARAPRGAGEADATFAAPPRPASAIICGDFNCKPASAEHRRMIMGFDDATPAFRDAWQVVHPGVPHAHSVGLHECPWPDEPYCCDFAFVTEDLAARVDGIRVNQETNASDHQPLLLALED